ncbi:hypothetical protein NKF25_15670 [Haladaptatus sp. AB643]|uniref:HalOD1 output domain-containing protein n=1 Tax=Haladaptatus sp. AB618 TaxID=2934173 RepID=UPI00209C4660|nr:HalOD1 output domain-containing protein [Haladaptatus sp. AB618]MCO8245500.1 hypothetical protein [Haladaptatus sp. AB643]MCO8255325.1 hypothetical protein [Haladaptatus sp. AB618]
MTDMDGSSPDRLVFDRTEYATVSEAVVDAVASVTAIDPLEMDPLYSLIDLDALERIVGPKLNGQRRNGNVTVEFQVNGHDVVVRSDGLIYVFERTETHPERMDER